MCGDKPCEKQDDYRKQVLGKATNEQKENDPLLARHCLIVFIYNVIHWKICHWNKNEIQKLRMSIVTQTVKIEVPHIDSKIMCKYILK
jgi:hypothetical protein